VVILTDLRQGIFTRIKCQELWKTEFKCIWLRCMWTSDFNCIWELLRVPSWAVNQMTGVSNSYILIDWCGFWKGRQLSNSKDALNVFVHSRGAVGICCYFSHTSHCVMILNVDILYTCVKSVEVIQYGCRESNCTSVNLPAWAVWCELDSVVHLVVCGFSFHISSSPSTATGTLRLQDLLPDIWKS
jgi:hypothetical protein